MIHARTHAHTHTHTHTYQVGDVETIQILCYAVVRNYLARRPDVTGSNEREIVKTSFVMLGPLEVYVCVSVDCTLAVVDIENTFLQRHFVVIIFA